MRPIRLEVYRTALPMRRFEHAAAARELAEGVVVRLECSDGQEGWGEALPRTYVTGESVESVLADLSQVLWPVLAGMRWSPGEAPPGVPRRTADGRGMPAAAGAVDLALSPWTLPGLSRHQAGGPPGKVLPARVSGVLGSADPHHTARRLGLMRWFGLRDFKLKLGLGESADAANLDVVTRRLGKALARGRCTLRVDVNGGWSMQDAPARVAELVPRGVCAVEQPTFCRAGDLADLARRCELPLIADESLLTGEDAAALRSEPKRVWWNVRIGKNGGLRPALDLLRMGWEGGVTVVLGCMVGETGILSAAQRRAIQLGPPPRFVEGNYGTFLLRDDLTRPHLRFGYGGTLKALKGPGLGVAVDRRRLDRYARVVANLSA